jgi:hypothetical protein
MSVALEHAALEECLVLLKAIGRVCPQTRSYVLSGDQIGQPNAVMGVVNTDISVPDQPMSPVNADVVLRAGLSSFSIPIICSTENLLRFIVCPSFRIDSKRSRRKISGSRQGPPPDGYDFASKWRYLSGHSGRSVAGTGVSEGMYPAARSDKGPGSKGLGAA